MGLTSNFSCPPGAPGPDILDSRRGRRREHANRQFTLLKRLLKPTEVMLTDEAHDLQPTLLVTIPEETDQLTLGSMGMRNNLNLIASRRLFSVGRLNGSLTGNVSHL